MSTWQPPYFPPYRPASMADYLYRSRMYNDSLYSYEKSMEIRRDLAKAFYTNSANNAPGDINASYRERIKRGYIGYFMLLNKDQMRGTMVSVGDRNVIPTISKESYLKHANEYFRYSNMPEVLKLMRSYYGLPVSPSASVDNTDLPAFHIYKKPVQQVLEYGPSKMDVIQPSVSISLPDRQPIRVAVPRVTMPQYRFQGGFVDPRVAAWTRQQVADDELLTREQLEYRAKLQQQR